MTKWLIRLSLAAVFVLGIHGEIVVGEFVGLGVFAYALPLAIDTYVVAAFRSGRDIPQALVLLAVTIGGGHFLIGATGGDTDRAVKALGQHGSVQQGLMGAAVGVVIVTVLGRVHVLAKAIKADEAAAAQKAIDDEKAARDAEIAEQERLAEIDRAALEQATRLKTEEAERVRAERREREQAELDRKDAEARIARENREHTAKLKAHEDERRLQAERERRDAEAAQRAAEVAERERLARIDAERLERERLAAEAMASADREARERAEAEARAAKAAAKSKPAVKAPTETVASKLHAVPERPSVEQATRDWMDDKIKSQEEAAEAAGVSTRTIRRMRERLEAPKAVNA